jgi:hypothetical protein
MSRKPLNAGFAWVLALVLIRSFVPAGYMPGLVDGGFSLIVCDAGAAQHRHHHQPDHASGGLRLLGGDCAYAQSASPALLVAVDLSPPQQQSLSGKIQRFDTGVPDSEPLRYRSARGPPA